MAERTVAVRLSAMVSPYTASMRQAAMATKQVTNEALDAATKHRAEVETVGRGLLGIGAAAATGLGLATKAAIDWESAWAGVRKTVDGSTGQMAALEGQLRDMAKELPSSHEEIAAVAEAAGQLGVQQENVAGFTRTMIDLGEATNLTADQAATSLARFSNIMGTAQGDVSRLGSTLVDLGNNSETTEAEILALGTRLAAAGKIAGLSEADVLAFAASLTSVGVEAEAGGTALSKVFTSMRDAVLNGGRELETFAQVAGTSAKDFARAFERDPARAIASFINGLGRMNAEGQSTTGVFDALGLSNERVMRALNSTAEAGDLLTDTLQLGNTAWTENTALTEEAKQRYETAAAQIAMAWNSIKDTAIEVGSVIAPIVADLAGFAGTIADGFGALPGPVKTAAAAVTGLAAAGGLLGGGLLLTLPTIARTREAIGTLGLNSGKTGKALRGVGRSAKIAGAGLGALLVLDQINGLFGESSDELRRYSEKLETAAGDGTQAKIRAVRDEIEQLEAIVGDVANTDLGPLANVWWTFDESVPQAADRLDHLRERLAELEHQQEISSIEAENGVDTAEELGGAYADQATATDDAVGALERHQEQLQAMTDPVFAMFDALDAVEQAQDDYNDAVDKHGKNSDEASAASIKLMRELEGLEQAAINGDLSFNDFSARLDKWVERGKITEGQADDIRERVKEARGETEDFEGDYQATLDVDTSGAREKVRKFKELLRGASDTASILDDHIPGRAHGGLIEAGGVPQFPSGGFVRGPGGPRDDAITARLSDGEFVVQASAVNKLGLDTLRAINAGTLPGHHGRTMGKAIPVSSPGSPQSPVAVGAGQTGQPDVYAPTYNIGTTTERVAQKVGEIQQRDRVAHQRRRR